MEHREGQCSLRNIVQCRRQHTDQLAAHEEPACPAQQKQREVCHQTQSRRGDPRCHLHPQLIQDQSPGLTPNRGEELDHGLQRVLACRTDDGGPQDQGYKQHDPHKYCQQGREEYGDHKDRVENLSHSRDQSAEPADHKDAEEDQERGDREQRDRRQNDRLPVSPERFQGISHRVKIVPLKLAVRDLGDHLRGTEHHKQRDDRPDPIDYPAIPWKRIYQSAKTHAGAKNRSGKKTVGVPQLAECPRAGSQQ